MPGQVAHHVSLRKLRSVKMWRFWTGRRWSFPSTHAACRKRLRAWMNRSPSSRWAWSTLDLADLVLTHW